MVVSVGLEGVRGVALAGKCGGDAAGLQAEKIRLNSSRATEILGGRPTASSSHP